jgi:hypothetical protein
MPHLEAAQSVDLDQRRWDDAADPAGFYPTSYQAEIPSGPECDEGRASPLAHSGPPGLVEQITSQEKTYRSARSTQQLLNKQQRINRMKKGVGAHADASREAMERGGHRVQPIMVTPTYAPGVDWHPKHITGLVNAFRDHFGYRSGKKLSYQWVMELTKKGVPHYHLLLWVPLDFRFPKPDDQGWWPHGSTRIERAEKAAGYIVKYASKGDVENPIPHGARLFGTGGEPAAALARHRACLPRWLRVKVATGRARRVTGVGWLAVDTGEIFQSPYIVDLHSLNSDGAPCVTVRDRYTRAVVLQTAMCVS